jgi:hypothetical protein
MAESKDGGGGSFYDKVYEAERPEIFFKATPHRVAAPGTGVRIRSDSKWNVPEPELTLAINSAGKIFGYTLGNDMSSRDIEGENLLYLPQAKTYLASCALGPFITVGASEADAREWTIGVKIERGGAEVFAGEAFVGAAGVDDGAHAVELRGERGLVGRGIGGEPGGRSEAAFRLCAPAEGGWQEELRGEQEGAARGGGARPETAETDGRREHEETAAQPAARDGDDGGHGRAAGLSG